MSKRLVLSILAFALAAIIFSVMAASFVNERDRRQALEASCRHYLYLAQGGMDLGQIRQLAREDGYNIRLLDADRGEPAGGGTMATYLADGDRAVYLTYADNVLFFLSERGRPVRWVVVVLTALSILFAYSMSRRILRPVTELTRASMEITAGQYDRRVQVRSHGEFGRLEHQFNTMAAKLQETIDQLDHRSAEMESIVNAMRNGMIAVDEQMHVIRINPVASKMFEVAGTPYGKYVLDVTRNAKLESHLAAAMEQGEVYTAELPVRIDRENRILRMYITGLDRDGRSIGALALIEDVTEIKRLENVRVDFVANVTHELKTPLTSIRGFVETLQQGAIDDRDAAMRFLEIVSQEAERLSRLIDDVLSISSLESGRKRDTIEPICFAKYTRQICELLLSSAREKDIDLRMEDRSDGAFVMGSADSVKQLLINLIDNAIKYSPDDGSVRVDLDVEDRSLILRVRDTGFGIEAEHIPRLFERFYRVDKGRSRSMGGTGLGLSIVKHIVLDMGGEIDVTSEYGKGSTFIVRLPIAEHAAQEDPLEEA